MRIALGIEYDGQPFHGWQSQADVSTVQDELERALSQIAAERLRITCAGRTDAGVHALNQVVHFDTRAQRPEQAWTRGVNALLPASISVRWARVVDDDFHARFAARRRHYTYLLYNHAVRPSLLHGRVGWHHRPLDAARMHAAARALIGEHDFTSFRAAECQARSPVKTLYQLDIRRHHDLVIFQLCANAFLQHMVRNIVGALVEVGNQRRPPETIAQLLAARDRRLAAPTFSAAGLYLCGVDYDASHQLPGQLRHPLDFTP